MESNVNNVRSAMGTNNNITGEQIKYDPVTKSFVTTTNKSIPVDKKDVTFGVFVPCV